MWKVQFLETSSNVATPADVWVVMDGSTRTGYPTVERQLTFTSGGTTAIVTGNTITGQTSGATATVLHVVLTSGSWAGGDAAGRMYIKSQTGTFQAENLLVSAVDLATIADNGTTGPTLGHVSGGNLSRTRGATNPILAGFYGNSSAVAGEAIFRIDLTSSGSKNIRMACGSDASDGANLLYTQVRDTSTALITLTDADGIANGAYVDAAGTEHASEEAWTSSNDPVNVSFSTTICNIALGNGSRQGIISYFEIEDAAGGGLSIPVAQYHYRNH